MSHTITVNTNIDFTPDMALIALAYQSLYGLDDVNYTDDNSVQGMKDNIGSTCMAFVQEYGVYPLRDKNHEMFQDDIDYLETHMRRVKERIIKVIPDFFD